MKTQRNKALALLAGLGIIGGSNALENAPIQELNATVQQIHYLSTDRTKIAELMQTVEKLTGTLNTLNGLIGNKLDHIDKTGFYLLDTLNTYLEVSFELVKSLITEEEAFTIYYNALRPFSSAISRLSSHNGILKQKLSLTRQIKSNMTQEELTAFFKSLEEWDREYAITTR